MPTCVHCAKRPVQLNGVTCGNSYCQEANYYANAARNARGKKAKATLREKQAECEKKAIGG